MTIDSPDRSQEETNISSLTSNEAEIDSSGDRKANSPLSSEPTIMMAVLPSSSGGSRGTVHGVPGSRSSTTATERDCVGTSTVAHTCATHDSVTPRTVSTATSTSSRPRSRSHVRPLLTHYSNHVEKKTTASPKLRPGDTLDTRNPSKEHKPEPPVDVKESTTEKSTTGCETGEPSASTETSSTMCKSGPTSLVSEGTTVDPPVGAPSVATAPQDIIPSSAAVHAKQEDVEGSSNTKEEQSSSKEDGTKAPRRKRTLPLKPGQSQGRWTHEEHQAFLEGLKVYGREWKKVADRIPTRTSAQIRSHAQKYFAKLAREESLVLQEQAHASYDAVPHESSGPAGSLSSLPPSVQRNVDRILADPTGAQREVEDTLRALQERYRQLQIQLQERNRLRRGAAEGPRRSNVVQDEDEPSQQDHRRHEVRRLSEMERRKRTFEDLTVTRRPLHHDDMSSGSPATSPSLKSFSPPRELADQELIAVHVLGGTLPRSSSNQELRDQEGGEANNASSANSSVGTSNEVNNPDDEATTDSKRPRLSGDRNSSDTEDSASPRDGMVL